MNTHCSQCGHAGTIVCGVISIRGDCMREICTSCLHCGDTHRSWLWPECYVAECGCGQRYELPGWLGRPYVGLQPRVDDGYIELRTCHCGSTISGRYAS